MKLIFKIFVISIILSSIFMKVIPEVSVATTMNEMINQFEAKDNSKISYDNLKDVIAKILGFLQVATGLASLIIIALTGYSYIVMTPPELKGETKRKMLSLIFGIVLVFSAVSIAKFIIGSLES